MTLRKKTFLIIGLALFGLIVISYAISSSILLAPFIRLEEEDTRQHVGRVVEGISESFSVLNSKATDWASLHNPSELLDIVAPQNTQASTLDTFFAAMEMNILLLLPPSGGPVVGKAFDLISRKELPIPALLQDPSFLEKLVLKQHANEGGNMGVLLLPEGPIWIASRLITTPGEPHLTGGTLVMGKYFDAAEVSRLGKKLNLSLSVHRLDNEGLSPQMKAAVQTLNNSSGVLAQPLSAERIAGFAMLRDIHDNPALLLQTDLPRTVFKQGKATVQLLTLALLTIGILTSLTIIVLLEKWILLPLTALCGNLKEIGSSADFRVRIASSGKDELSRVAATFNGVLDALEKSQQGLQVACNELEARVYERTEELLTSNKALQDEILERKLAEKALRQSEERLNLVLHGSRDGFWDWNVQTGEVHYDACYARMLGYELNELEPHMNFWKDRVHPEDLPGVSRQLDAHFSGATEYYEAEQRLKTRSGEWKWFLDRGKVVERDPNGAPLRAAGTLTDISERKRMEETVLQSRQLLEKMFTGMDQAVFVVDAKSQTILASNPAVESIFGYTEGEVLGRNTEFLHLDQERHNLFQGEMASTVLCKGVYQAEFPMRKKDGSQVSTEHTVTQMLDEAHNIILMVHVVRDITQKKKMEEELIRVKKLEAAGILAGGIAHDFNNLLAVILGNINMLQEDLGTGSPTVKLLADAEKAALRASDLTKRFITFATGGSLLKRVTFVQKLIQDAVSLASSGTNVECRYSLPDHLWKVEIDEGQMSQAIYNIILNAREAMPSGGLISIVGENVDAGSAQAPTGIPVKTGQYVRICICDEGVGIHEENKDKIFDPYFSTKDKGVQKGMGLGLAIAHSIINKHDGYIVVESQMGTGTTFQIYLPAFQKGLPPKSIPENGKHVLRVLLMDDEKLMRDMVSKMLLHLGYDVEVAEDGTEAVEIYKKAKESGNPFHLVILDLTVKGGMGGLQALNALKQYDSETKAIVSSGYSQDPVIAHFEEYGFCAAIGKPYSLEKLEKVLNCVLER